MTGAVPQMAKSKEEQQWIAESDFDTLVRYREICKDKPRYKRAIAVGKAKHDALQSVMDEHGKPKK